MPDQDIFDAVTAPLGTNTPAGGGIPGNAPGFDPNIIPLNPMPQALKKLTEGDKNRIASQLRFSGMFGSGQMAPKEWDTLTQEEKDDISGRANKGNFADAGAAGGMVTGLATSGLGPLGAAAGGIAGNEISSLGHGTIGKSIRGEKVEPQDVLSTVASGALPAFGSKLNSSAALKGHLAELESDFQQKQQAAQALRQKAEDFRSKFEGNKIWAVKKVSYMQADELAKKAEQEAQAAQNVFKSAKGGLPATKINPADQIKKVADYNKQIQALKATGLKTPEVQKTIEQLENLKQEAARNIAAFQPKESSTAKTIGKIALHGLGYGTAYEILRHFLP